ncbi:MAG: glutamine amidotransferase [Rubritalea sp.]|jgi:glutamine amidotransferase
MKVGIIDYGAGNLHSVHNAFIAIGADATIITSPSELRNITHLVLPGQGEFGDCSRKLQQAGMFDIIHQWISDDKPFLGICVGYQLLFEGSDESPDTAGLGIFKGTVVKFKPEPGLKIPHMGWNIVRPTQPEHPMWEHLIQQQEAPYFYYVHSYYPALANPEESACTTTHGSQTFHGAITKGKLFATQFHPEKSQHAGLQLLRNFCALK